MGVGFDLPAPPTSLLTRSMKILAQFTGLSLVRAPNIVLPKLWVIRMGLSGCTMGTRNSRTLRSRASLHSLTGNPSLGLTS